jgi:HEAT repeat protein
MLMLLARSRYIPDNFSAVAWTRHPDARVRTEAVRLQLLLPHEREVAVRTALVDPDPRIVHIGLSAMRDACPPELVGRLVEIAVEPPETAEDNRLPAVNALSRIRHPMVLDALLYLTDGGRSFLGRLKLPQKTPVLVAALRALAATWSDDPEAAAVLAAAARSSDPELRDAGTLLRA